jgi:hypothetical protein
VTSPNLLWDCRTNAQNLILRSPNMKILIPWNQRFRAIAAPPKRVNQVMEFGCYLMTFAVCCGVLKRNCRCGLPVPPESVRLGKMKGRTPAEGLL